jgi:hypothetical protein
VLLFLTIAYKLRKSLIKKGEVMDEENSTPSDYSLMAYNLPQNKT